ncbi:MAG: hypothetical protein IKX45_06415 [Bacteroidales bacterium]|nr:hypothetical protein [Bacteroidales bacterium]
MKKLAIILMTALVALVSCNKDDANLDGRWNAPRHPGGNDYVYSFVFKGNTLDIYVIAYGWHCTGTYTYSNNVVKYNITGIQQSLSEVEYDSEGKVIGHSGGGMGSLNQETLEPVEGNEWYDLGITRKDLLDEYKDNYSSFTFKKTSSTTAECDIMAGPEDMVIFTKQK